jgi:hypothetical protein
MWIENPMEGSIGIGYSYNLLTVVGMIIDNPVKGPQTIRYTVQCLCGRKFTCDRERFINGVEYNKRAGRSTHQCCKKCTY